MSYVPNASDATQPLGTVLARTAAEEFRALKTKINNLQGIAVTWNPADASSNIELSGGNLVTAPATTLSSTSFASCRGTVVKNSGKWYYEVTFTGNAGATVGVATVNANLETGAGVEVYSWALATGTGNLYHAGAIVGNIGGPVAAGSTVGFGYNASTGDIYINSSYGQALFVAVAGLAGASVYPIISVTYLTDPVIANFGAATFVYAIPPSYIALFQPSYVYAENPNLILNGNCAIDQQNAGALQTPIANNTYMTDGWIYFGDVAAKHQAQQNLNAVTPPSGYVNYQGISTIAAYVPAANEAFWAEQRIEGYNTAPLSFGDVQATPITLYFMARSSVSGLHSGVLCNGTDVDTYPFSFTIPAANTWTGISIIIPGNTTGTWNSLTTGVNMKLRFCLGAGATRKRANGSWISSAANIIGVTGAVDVVSTLGATFYWTGVELRRGVYAVDQPRELVRYEDQLARCLRYYQKTAATYVATGYAAAVANVFHIFYRLQQTMRVAPAVSTTFAGSVNCAPAIANIAADSFSITLTAAAGGLMFSTYSTGNTFDARL